MCTFQALWLHSVQDIYREKRRRGACRMLHLHSANVFWLDRPNSPAPATKSLHDLRSDGHSDRQPYENETLVDSIRKSQLSPDTWIELC